MILAKNILWFMPSYNSALSKLGIFIILTLFTQLTMAELVTRYDYADGSGNVYRLAPYHFAYEPVTPEISSSGIYSGGSAVQKTLSRTDYETALALFKAAINNQMIHIQQRVMGSGLIVIYQNQQRQTILLSQSGKEKIALEQFLQTLLQRNSSANLQLKRQQ